MNNKKESKIFFGRPLFIGIILIISLLVIYSFLSYDDEVPQIDQQSEPVKTKRKKAHKKSEPKINHVLTNTTAYTKTPQTAIAKSIPSSKKIVRISTNSFGQVNELYQTPDGRLHRRIYKVRKSIFDNAADQLLSMAVNARPGARIAPMPNMKNVDLDKIFINALKRPIRIDPDDTNEIKDRKRSVAIAREEMLQLMCDGYSFSEALNAYRDSINDAYVMRNDAKKILKDFINEGDEELAKQYLKKANELLRKSGIDEISMPENDDDGE